MHKVLSEDELVHITPDFSEWMKSRNLTVDDELFTLVRMLLLANGDARVDLVNYIQREARKSRESRGAPELPQLVIEGM